MKKSPKGILFLLTALACFCFSALSSKAQTSQWTGPDASNNIYNNNTGAVIVQAPTTVSNAGQLFFVNPRGKGNITLGELNTASGSYTSLSLGIGTTNPQAVLEITGGGLGTTSSNTLELARMGGYSGNYSQLRFNLNRFTPGGTSWLTASTHIQAWTDVTPQSYIEFNPNGATYGIAFGNGSGETMRLLSGGNLLIGKTSTNNPSYMLDVNGTGRLNTVVVNSTGADYVFDPGFQLLSLEQLEAYVRNEHHLPGIAPAAQMQQEGLNLGDNQTRLLAKIEELTLYLIRQNKETQALKDEQEKETQALKDKIKILEERNRSLEDLEQRIEKLEHPKN
jgi:hypothetical protein